MTKGAPRRAAWFIACLATVCLLLRASPTKTGYQESSFARADIDWPVNTRLAPDYAAIDFLMDDSERFHHFRFQHRVNIVACRNWSDFHDFVPFIEGETVGGLTLEYGTRIYITPRVEEMGLPPGEFIRHELSHAVILQNSPIASRGRFKRVPWLYEGLAVMAANQKAYGSAADFVRRARTEDLAPLFDPAAFERPDFDLRMAYRAWRYFLEDLIATQGRERFQVLLARFMLDPAAVNVTFAELYGQRLSAAIAVFDRKVRAGEGPR